MNIILMESLFLIKMNKFISYDNINLSQSLNKIKINKEINKIYNRKKKNKVKFYKAYKGNNKFNSINNLDYGNEDEIRICSIYNEIIGSWTKIQKMTTKDFDSIILKELDKKNDRMVWIKKY